MTASQPCADCRYFVKKLTRYGVCRKKNTTTGDWMTCPDWRKAT